MILKSIFILIFLLKNGFSQHECDLNCHFTEQFVNSETIKFWPKSCVTVCGDLYLVGDTNVSSARLGQIFHRLEYLHGNVKIENTKYTTLSFLSKLREFDCFTEEFIITGNPSLYNMDGIKNLITHAPCLWTVFNNSKLDVQKFTETWSNGWSSDLYAYGNLKDPACKNEHITPEALPYYQNCSFINGTTQGVLKITRVGPNDDLSGLLKLKSVSGNIEVYNTNLQNLSFMNNFQSHVGERFQPYNITNIHDNQWLTRLGWDSLTHLDPDDYGYTINIQNNHPDFCLSTAELQVFAEHSVAFYSQEAVLCKEYTRKDGQKVCNLEPLSIMDWDCQHVIGVLEINSDNEKDVGKLKKMTNLYGSLTIDGTKELTDLKFLANLRQIATLKTGGYPLLRILNNKMIGNVTLPKMKTAPFPIMESMYIIIDGNSKEIFKNRRECLLFQAQTKTPIKYNGKSCGKLPAADGSTGRGGGDGEFEEWEEH
ncbi:unnamed protein product [Caenorhabditis brenneri]